MPDPFGRVRIALWDVLKSCERAGATDTNIRAPRPNDIAGFMTRHPELRQVAFNGRKAEELFQQLCGKLPEHIKAVRLPSTSPANTRPDKVDTWTRTIRPVLDEYSSEVTDKVLRDFPAHR